MDNSLILKKSLALAQQHTPNAKYMAFVDFSRMANESRFFLINLKDKRIDYEWYTTHGKSSGGLAKAVAFSNVPNSNKSSKGLMKTKSTYYGKNGYSLRLEGLEPGINDNVESRAIVIHPSNYVSIDYMNNNQFPGRSLGCICLEPSKSGDIIDKLQNGSLVYVHT